MNHRLILIEGIPGSGKSTLSARLETWLKDQGIAARLYSEGDAHPADLACHGVDCEKRPPDAGGIPAR